MGRDARDSKKKLQWKALNNQDTSILSDSGDQHKDMHSIY